MNIIISGTSRGIGLELVRLFCQSETNKVIGLSRNYDRMRKHKKDNNFENYYPIHFDLEEFDKYTDVLSQIKSYFKKVDILINNSGFLLNKHFEEFSLEEKTKIFNINIIGQSELIKKMMPLLKESKNAHVVNISSMGGFQGSAKFPGLTFYSSSKAAIANLTECLAEEYKDTKIKFNCLALGAAQTEMLAEAFPGYKAPLQAEEMAEYIYDFALFGNKYYNGKVLPVSISTP
jgi:3-oxoacyl-[acyl-carrier protein] reductase